MSYFLMTPMLSKCYVLPNLMFKLFSSTKFKQVTITIFYRLLNLCEILTKLILKSDTQ